MSKSLPIGWQFKRLCQVVEIDTGFAFRSKEFVPEGGVPIVRMSNLSNGRLDMSNAALVSISVTRPLGKYRLHHGDFLIGLSGSLSNYAWVSRGDGECFLNQRIGRITAEDEATARFAAYWYLSEPTQSRIVSDAAGAAQLNISPKQLGSFQIALPPLPEQRKIAEILSSVDEAIGATQAVIEQTRRVKEGLLQELLTKGIGHTRFKQTAIGEIPESWSVKLLSDLAHVVRGSSPRPARDPRYFDGDHTPWITVGLLPKGDSPFLNSTPSFLTKEGARHSRFLPSGTVVLSNSGFGCGVPKILSIGGCANDGIAAFLDLSKSVAPLFLYYFLFSRTQWLRKSVARGVDQPNLNTALIGGISMPLPPLKEQIYICCSIEKTDRNSQAANQMLTSLKKLKAGLLQDLLTGKVRVSV